MATKVQEEAIANTKGSSHAYRPALVHTEA